MKTSLEVERSVCDRCHEQKLFLPEETYFELTASPEARWFPEFSGYSAAELRHAAESHCQPEACQAAAPLKQRTGSE